MTGKRTIGIAAIGELGQEPYAIRSVLEYFGFRVMLFEIGRPNELISVLNKSILYHDVEYLIICSHGENGKIITPKLGDEVYDIDEPKENFGEYEIRKYAYLNDMIVITTACTVGKLSKAFKSVGCKHFIGTETYIDGNATLIFMLNLFYELSKGSDLKIAFDKVKAADTETANFTLY